MIFKIKKRIEKELVKFVRNIDKFYSLNKISPLLSKNIKEFVLRDGKRVRPILFILAYLGFVKKPAKNFYAPALAIELLHDFLLVHDDIIDKSDTRRGKPSMHVIFNNFLAKRKNIKFNGQDLTIIVGDIMYAMAVHSFLSVKEDMKRKEMALRKFVMSATHTGSGEFIELIYGIKNFRNITKQTILRVYDYKTAYYTFSSPLSTGAILAGADRKQSDMLFNYGIYLGRAFQIKDDLLSIFADEKKIGKSALSDLQESKKTLPLWHAYNKTKKGGKKLIERVLNKRNVSYSDLLQIRKIMKETDTIEFARKEISSLIEKAEKIIKKIKMKLYYKNTIEKYIGELLNI